MSPLTPASGHRSHAVLGLCSYTHDSAAALLIDGKLEGFVVFDEVFVPPAPGDAGTAIGAAAAAHQAASSLPPTGLTGCYLGPEYPDVPINLARWPSLVERLNASVKFRELFRPFAPMVLAEHAADYLTPGQRAPFMSMASGVTDLARTLIPIVVHANGTARLQTVTQAVDPFVYAVLTAFIRRTGVPVLINTSLNVKGKPLCGTPAIALECLAESGPDAFMLEERWFTK